MKIGSYLLVKLCVAERYSSLFDKQFFVPIDADTSRSGVLGSLTVTVHFAELYREEGFTDLGTWNSVADPILMERAALSVLHAISKAVPALPELCTSALNARERPSGVE